jgi:23S rRNA pseudouridine2604 synthase
LEKNMSTNISKDESVRINKYLSAAGVMSRREADKMLDEGRISINGSSASKGDRVCPGDVVCVDKKEVKIEQERVILLFNKPKGVVCTSFKGDKNNIIDYINYPIRVYNVGRLDKESRGLILLTNMGELVNPLSRASSYHEKEYVVKVDHGITPEFIHHMRNGIYLEELDVTTRKCQVIKTDYNEFNIILTQGLNKQIRRMCEAEGYYVHDLRRIRIMNLRVDDIPEGKYRKISTEEEKELFRQLNLTKECKE